MHFIHFSINRPAFIEWTYNRSLGTQNVCDIDFAMHHFLDETFGRSALKPFRVMRGRNSGETISVYGYSKLSSIELDSAAQIAAPPDTVSLIDFGQMVSREMPSSLSPGIRLGFDLKTIPVRRRSQDKKEVDVHILDRLETPQIKAKTSYYNWVYEKFGTSVMMEEEDFHITNAQRRLMIRKGREVEKKEVTLSGVVTLIDPDGFQEVLAKGIGRHKSYGFGMVMLRHA